MTDSHIMHGSCSCSQHACWADQETCRPALYMITDMWQVQYGTSLVSGASSGLVADQVLQVLPRSVDMKGRA